MAMQKPELSMDANIELTRDDLVSPSKSNEEITEDLRTRQRSEINQTNELTVAGTSEPVNQKKPKLFNQARYYPANSPLRIKTPLFVRPQITTNYHNKSPQSLKLDKKVEKRPLFMPPQITTNYHHKSPQSLKLDKKVEKRPLFVPPQITTYSQSLNSDKKVYNHITKQYMSNFLTIANHLNTNPVQDITMFRNHLGYTTQKLKNLSKLIAMPETSSNLVATTYKYGLLSVVYTKDGSELARLPEISNAVKTYLRITKAELLYVRCYSTTAEVTYEEIKAPIHAVKIGIARDMIIPESYQEQEPVKIEDLPELLKEKRATNVKVIFDEIFSNYMQQKPIWKYFSKNQTLIYSRSKTVKGGDMQELRNWMDTLVEPDEEPKTKAIKKNFVTEATKKLLCMKFNQVDEHNCSYCGGITNVIPEVELE